MPHVATQTEEMQHCIENCQDCQRICVETAAHCLMLGGKHASAEHLLLLFACAEICKTSATFMMLGTELHTETCRTCARVCNECADSCERNNDDDPQMRECARICRECATSCGAMTPA